MTERRISLADVVTWFGLVAMSMVAVLLVLNVAGRAPWSNPSRPAGTGTTSEDALSLRPMPRIVGEPLPGLDGVARSGAATSSMPASAPDDQPAARQAANFVEHAFTLPPDSRLRWVRAYTAPTGVAPVDRFLTAWIEQVNGGRDLRPSDEDPDIAVRTIGYRTLRTSGPAARRTVTVILWQQVSRQDGGSGSDRAQVAGRKVASAAGSGYVLNYITLTRTDGYALITSMDGVVPGPQPAWGLDVIYPPLDR